MPFNKLQHSKKSEYVVSQILEAIQAREYKVGDRLPPELEISEMIEVSRPAVREALSALRLVGVIETRVGQGTFVKSDKWTIGGEKGESIIQEILESSDNTFEALEARRIVEPAIAQVAVDMPTGKGIGKISRAFHGMEKSGKEKDYYAFHEFNKIFHCSIVEMTKNASLINYVNSLVNLFTGSDLGSELRRRYLTEQNYIWEAIEVHRHIHDSIVNHDKVALQSAFLRHFDQVEKQLLGK